jgi:ASCH domain
LQVGEIVRARVKRAVVRPERERVGAVDRIIAELHRYNAVVALEHGVGLAFNDNLAALFELSLAAGTSGFHKGDYRMKALTIKQPWAGLIAAGLKPIENRTWATKYRGPLLIHVSARMPIKPAVWDQFREDHPETADIDYETLLEQCGKIICRVELVDCVPIARLPMNLRGHWTAEGPVCWIVRNPVAFEGQPAVKAHKEAHSDK